MSYCYGIGQRFRRSTYSYFVRAATQNQIVMVARINIRLTLASTLTVVWPPDQLVQGEMNLMTPICETAGCDKTPTNNAGATQQ